MSMLDKNRNPGKQPKTLITNQVIRVLNNEVKESQKEADQKFSTTNIGKYKESTKSQIFKSLQPSNRFNFDPFDDEIESGSVTFIGKNYGLESEE